MSHTSRTRTPLSTPPIHARRLGAVQASDRVPTVYDPRYVTDAAPLTSTTKAGLVMAAHDADLVYCPSGQPKDLSRVWDHIAQWHHGKYTRAVRTGHNKGLAGSQGFVWSPAFAASVARIWYGQHYAQRLARQVGRAVLHPVSGAHHAHPAYGSGFCTFNYAVAALGAIKAEDPHANVAVIDLDAHWGDGTVAFATDVDRALHVFDIHGSFKRNTSEVFCGGRIHDYGVRDLTGYWDALAALPAFLATHEITDAVYLAGMDPFEGDPVGGVHGMTASALYARDLFVISLLEAHGIATVVNFAGGYVPDKVVELHGGTIRAMQTSRHTLSLVTRMLSPRGA